MLLRLKTLDKLSSKELGITIRDFQGDMFDDFRENIILRLVKNLKGEERQALLDGLRNGQLLKALDSGFHDFITLFGDNYPDFVEVINDYMADTKNIRKETYIQWMETLSADNKSYNIAEKGQQEFIKATCVLDGGKVKLTLKQATPESYTITSPYGVTVVPIYNARDITLNYDEPVVLYHNGHKKGLDKGLLGSMEIVPALQLHYYLQTHKDQQLADAGWAVFDVATLFIGVGEITAGVKGIRLALAAANIGSSVTSLVANVGEEYFINEFGAEGQKYINALQIISAVSGFADLGAAGISKLKNVCKDELVEIGAFYRKNGDKLKASQRTEIRDIERYTREMYENFDQELLRMVDNVVGSQAESLINNIRNFPNLERKFGGMSEALKTRFLDDFANASEDILRLLNKQDSELLEGWIKFRNKYPNRKICM